MPKYLIECAYDDKAKAYKIVTAKNEYEAEKLLQEGKFTLTGNPNKFERAHILLKTTYYDSMAYSMMEYKDYKAMCEDNDWEAKPEGSQEYYDDIGHLTSVDLDDFLSNLEYSKYNVPCMLTGSAGLWNGRHQLCPVKYDTLLEGVKDIMRRADVINWEIRLTEGHLKLIGKHHDGTNNYELHLLSSRGIKEADRPKYTWEGHDYEPKPFWFKKIYGWLL